MTDKLPLAGLNIAVTRPRAQATMLTLGIQKLGGNCIPFPLLEITPLLDDSPLREIASRLHEYYLAIFISPNAVHYGMQAIQSAGGLPATLQIATVGSSSAKALLEYGVNNVITPKLRFDSESLLALPELQEVTAKNIVIFRGDSGRELLGDTLKLRGAKVEYVTCYHRSQPQHDIRGLLVAGPDALCVSSSDALHNLHQMSKATDTKLITALPLFVTHERIAATARKLGWQHIITATGGDEGLLAALTAWAEHRQS